MRADGTNRGKLLKRLLQRRIFVDYHLGQADKWETSVNPSETTIAPSDLPERTPQSSNTNSPNKSRIESLVNIFSGRANGHHAAHDEGRRTDEETTEQLGRSNGH
jgi:hypothetical protein